MGVALTHLPAPAKLDAKPAPEGEVLEISVTVTDKVKPKDSFVIPFARYEGQVYATDFIEYDLAVAKGSPLKGFYYSPFKGNYNKDEVKLHFKRGEGVDQFGREQVTGPAPQGGAGEWEHRIIGLSSYGPGIAPGHAIVFKGAKPGNYKIYIDNLRLRHADGTTTPVWTNAKQTWTVKIQPNELYQDIKIRAVDVKDVGK